jgi:mRNA interferase RelE/StbE
MKFLEIKAMYEMLLSRKASHFIKTLQESYKEKIKDALRNLMENPFSYPHKKIKGKTNMYRIRVGKYRVLYKVDEKKEILTVLKIDKRSRVYR